MNNNPVEERKAKFYERVRKATNLSVEEIRQYLSERYEKYDPNMEKEYLEGLFMWGKLQHYAKKAAVKPDLHPCPVCNSATAPDRNWGWICTAGGLRHRIVNTVSRMSDIPADKLLQRLEEFDNDKEALRSATRAAEERSEIRYLAER